MKKVSFNGCSFSAGEGFDPDQREFYIYDRLVCRELGWQHTNIAKGGSSNLEIFMRTAMQIEQNFDIFFVQWSGLNRMWFYPGPDCEWSSLDSLDEFRYREIQLNKQAKIQFQQNLLVMNHDYHNILRLIDFCSILDRLASRHNKIIIYINGLVPWTDDLCKVVDPNNLSDSLSAYTKQMLDFDHRDDSEIYKFVVHLQDQFAKLDRTKWVNIFESFHHAMVDLGPQGHHPGTISHRIMADKILRYLEQQDII